MKKNAGFTLIEMMIVVTIIAILLAIAIPNMLRARVEANQASAIGDLRVIGAAQITYNTTRSTFGGFDELTELAGGAGTSLLDETWTDGRNKNGYTFTMPTVNANNFECFADPREVGMTGVQYFRVDASGVIRYDLAGRPDPTSPSVGSTGG